MGQQHRVHTKRKRRKAYLERKKAALRARQLPNRAPAKPRTKKEPAAAE